MKHKINSWKDRFNRECKYKNSIIVYGNIDDLVLDEKKGTYITVMDSVLNQLKDSGYQNIVKWDRVDGIDYDVSTINHNFTSLNSESNSQNNTNNGISYDFDDEEDDNSSDISNESNVKYEDINEFFSFMLNKIKSKSKKSAFIIDYSDYIFGSSNNLSECERSWLSILSKTLNNLNNYDMLSCEFNELGNVIILITQKISNIPTAYYINSSVVSTINIPLPGRNERDLFLRSNLSMLSVLDNINTDNVKYNDLVDTLDGFTLKDISQIIKMSKQESPKNFKELINTYKYGEKTSPWEELSREKLLKITERLKERVKGQDDAIDKIKDVIIRAYTGFSGLQHSSNQKKPKGSLFFVGPTGVGKTELAKSLAEFLFGDENACIRFDMSEFNHEHSDQRLVGAPPGYVGYEEGGQLTNKIKERPFSVLLFDEIEKAHGKILDKFLQILEDGRLTDGKGETVYFSESIIIFTSNIGAGEISPSEGDKDKVAGKFIAKVENHFINELGRPELLNRIGKSNIVPFNFIEDNEIFIQIAKSKLAPIKTFTKERYKVDLEFEDEEQALLAIAKASGVSNGGRGLINIIESSIVNGLSTFIFEKMDEIYPGRKIIITQVIPNKILFDFELR